MTTSVGLQRSFSSSPLTVCVTLTSLRLYRAIGFLFIPSFKWRVTCLVQFLKKNKMTRRGCQGLSATSFRLVFIADRRPYSTVYRRRSSLFGCHCLCLEQFTTGLPVTSQDSSFYHFLPHNLTMYNARAVTLHFGQSNRSSYTFSSSSLS